MTSAIFFPLSESTEDALSAGEADADADADGVSEAGAELAALFSAFCRKPRVPTRALARMREKHL